MHVRALVRAFITWLRDGGVMPMPQIQSLSYPVELTLECKSKLILLLVTTMTRSNIKKSDYQPKELLPSLLYLLYTRSLT